MEKKKAVKIKKSVSIKKNNLERVSKTGNASQAIDLAIEQVYGKYEKVATKIAVFNQKGGVSKTISTLHLAEGLASKGKRVLLVDFDSQANLTKTFNKYNPETPSIYSVIFGENGYKEAIVNIKENLDLIPSNIYLSNFDRRETMGIKEFLLKEAFEEIDREGYDFIFVDCPPSLSKITFNVLSFVNKIYIPVQAENYALDGVNDIIESIKIAKKKFQNPHLHIGGVFCTLVDLRSNDHKEIIKMVEDMFGNKMMSTIVRRSADVVTATRNGKTVFENSAKSKNGYIDYTSLVNEFLVREESIA